MSKETTISKLNGPIKKKIIDDEENVDEWKTPKVYKDKKEDKNKLKEIPIKCFYYINKNKTIVNDLKDGRRIFNNKTELNEYNADDPEFNMKFIDFDQLLFENLLLNDDFSENRNEKPSVQSALFSSFVYDETFIEEYIRIFKIKTIIVLHSDQAKYTSVDQKGSYSIVLPKIQKGLSWGKFHSKLILLKFPNFLRVIVPSANLTFIDWRLLGQIIWFQDFPLKNKDKEEESEFKDYLDEFMDTFMPHTYKEKRLWTDLDINLNNYDFSDACVDLIASANGRFKEDEIENYGIGRIKSLTKNKYKHLYKNNHIMIQCSSIGNTKKVKFYEDLKNAFNLTESSSYDIIYPSSAFVNSFIGKMISDIPLDQALSGCLFCTKDAREYHKSKFKDINLKKDYESRKTVFHSKCFITGNKDKNGKFSINDNSLLYFGSHNFSGAAFGNYEKSDSQIAISNYELGIIFNPNKVTLEEKMSIYNTLLLDFNCDYYRSDRSAFSQEDTLY